MKRLICILSLLLFMFLVSTCNLGENKPDSNALVSFSIGDPAVDLLVTGDDMWIGTGGGIVRCNLKTGITQRYTVLDGLGSNVVRKLVQDSLGNIWATCHLAGVSRFDGTRWENFTVSDGLINNDVITLEADRQGGVWVSAYWGVSYFDGIEWHSFTNMEPGTLVVGGENTNNPDATIIKYVELSAVDVIFIDSQGVIWFSNRNKGVTRFDHEDWKLFSSEDGLAEGGVSAITEAKDGNLWFGGMKGITCFDGSQFQVLAIKEHQSIIPRPYIQDIREDEQGNIWVAAFGGGVSCYDGANWRVFTSADGLPGDNARSIYLDSEDNPCVITDKGVGRFNGTRWQILTTEDGLPYGEIKAVETDDEGNIWFGTAEGEIQRFEK